MPETGILCSATRADVGSTFPRLVAKIPSMTDTVRDSIYEAIASIRLIDPHTHINPHAPASNTLADLLGYHYYTELAHSAGMPKAQIEEDGISHHELVRRLVTNLSPIENTAQYRWLIEICRKFFGFTGERLDESNWEEVYETSEAQMQLAEWPQMVLDQSNVEAVFLTNDFDDELEGFDCNTYIPCLRTDDLVFHLSKPQTRERLAACTGIELNGSLTNLRESLRQRFEHFVGRGARACAISLPPDFCPLRVSDGRATTALNEVLLNGVMADQAHQTALSRRVFWTLAELCDEYGLPFDLMIGVNRGVYPDGVFQGQDLYDSRVSLIQYRDLFNAFPQVKFPVSVLASVTNQELVSYAWIFPNVITNGHWWYSNTPSFITRDAAARLEAVPQTKQIAYYSDAYKLEFVWPKFDMYRNILSGILTDHFVKGSGWSEERAIELGRQVLRTNVDAIFPRPNLAIKPEAETAESIHNEVADSRENPEPISLISDEELDPLPSHDEIQSANADDVQLFNDSVEQRQPNPDALAPDIDPEPLDVGDILGSDTEASANPDIRMLRGEDSFEVDEESLLLRPDPTTGELKFPSSDSDESPPRSND